MFDYLELKDNTKFTYPSDYFYFDDSLSYKRYIALKHSHNDGYDLVELYTQETIDLSQFEQEKQNYIINYLKLNHCFISYATQDDLPLLMNLLEEMEHQIPNIEFSEIITTPFSKLEEQDMQRLSFCPAIEAEMRRAHHLDEGKPDIVTQLTIDKNRKITSQLCRNLTYYYICHPRDQKCRKFIFKQQRSS